MLRVPLHFKSILVCNLKTIRDFFIKMSTLHNGLHNKLGFYVFLFSLVLDLAYIDYLLCQIWSVYMHYSRCCDHSNYCLFPVIQPAKLFLLSVCLQLSINDAKRKYIFAFPKIFNSISNNFIVSQYTFSIIHMYTKRLHQHIHKQFSESIQCYGSKWSWKSCWIYGLLVWYTKYRLSQKGCKGAGGATVTTHFVSNMQHTAL